MRHKISCLYILLVCLSSFPATADNLLQLSAGISFWNSTPDGSFGETADSVLTLDKKSAVQSSYYLTIEHPFPLAPNIKLSKTATSNNSSSTLDKTFVSNGSIFRVASALDVTADYDQLDVITYFEIFDNRTLELDLGITFRQHSIHTQVTNQNDKSESVSNKVSDLEVLAYAAGKVNLPLLSIGAFIETSVVDKNSYDLQAGVSYEFDATKLAKTYLQVGVRTQTFEFTNLDGLYTQLDWQELFVGVEVRF
ncbi:MAG: outer membrane protein [Psychrosphaera sp.]|jgi:outer membrane protein|uniref:TIGR04219 family outer membrane beta-barrel protein n=1 Tax=Psychrosphaera sp. F3M07 TaxID=2841560 RepID=UPI001C09A9E9|nr:TIGR04219 family outer membrane beta-barrel protein [Psychrosphaera sp. F3M07]MBU2919054.1 TIGR04219 family outer membrane beta-barrel protein [Psychrosphaera sp. F3M07]